MNMFIQKNPYDTSKIKLNNIHELIKQRNFNQHNPFNINYSTYYGIEYALKEFIGFPKDYEIKAFFDHGITFTSALEAAFRIHESLPTITCSEFRKNIILSKKNNGVYSIGPYIAYAKSLLNKSELKEEKNKIGKNILVFPLHSTNKTQYDYSLKNFTNEILKFSDDFDSITVCLFWKDVEKGLDKYYKNLNFNVVTAGYTTDPMFLKRLRSIIELSDMTISNGIGSHTGYCIYLKKPHIYIPTKTNLVIKKADNEPNIKDKLTRYLENQYEIKTNHNDLENIKKILSDENRDLNKIPPILDKYYGFNQVKTKKELKKIVENLEDEFSRLKFYLTLPKLFKYYLEVYYKAYEYKIQ